MLLFEKKSPPSPHEIEGLDDRFFRAIQTFGDKTHPPGPVKVSRLAIHQTCGKHHNSHNSLVLHKSLLSSAPVFLDEIHFIITLACSAGVYWRGRQRVRLIERAPSWIQTRKRLGERRKCVLPTFPTHWERSPEFFGLLLSNCLIGKFTAIIILYFHLPTQFKYALFSFIISLRARI